EDGDTLGQPYFLPRPILLVLADRDDDRLLGVINPGGDLPLQRPLEGPLEVAQRLRPGLADAGVAVADSDAVLLAARRDARQGQLLAEDLGHLLHGQLDLEDVPAGRVAGAGAGLLLPGPERLADLAVALADAAGALLAEAELGDLDLRQGDGDEV